MAPFLGISPSVHVRRVLAGNEHVLYIGEGDGRLAYATCPYIIDADIDIPSLAFHSYHLMRRISPTVEWRGGYWELLRHYSGVSVHPALPHFENLADLARFWHEAQPWPDVPDTGDGDLDTW